MKRVAQLAFLILVLTTPILGQMQQGPVPPDDQQEPRAGGMGQPPSTFGGPRDPMQPPDSFNRPMQPPDGFGGPGNMPPGRDMRGGYGQGPPAAFQSDFGGLYRQPEEMKQQWNEFQQLAAPDLRPQQRLRLGSSLAVTDRISPEKMVSGMIVERLSEYFDQEDLLKNCPDDGKITDTVMEFIDRNDYVLEDICWPVEDRVEDCKLEREQCEEIKQPKTRGGFSFTCPASEESVEKECLAEGEKRLDEESKRFTENAPAMCEREWLMNEITVTQMCQDNCDEQRFLQECERQVQNMRQREQWQQPPPQENWQQPQQWGERRPEQPPMPPQGQQMPSQGPQMQQPPMPPQDMQQPMLPQGAPMMPPPEGQPVPPEGQIPMPAEAALPPETPVPPAEPATPVQEPAPVTEPAPPPPEPAAPTGYVIAALAGNTDCSQQLENFRQMCRQITEKSDRMCSKESFITDCKERNQRQFNREQISQEMGRMCKQSAKRGAVMMNRACRQMEHEYKKCTGMLEQACSSAQEQADICNDQMGREKVKEAVSEKAKELCRFSEYRKSGKTGESNDGQMPLAIAVAGDTPESSIESLRKLTDGLSESRSEGDIRIYTARTSQQNYESIKKLDFVLDARPYEFGDAGGKGIKTAVSVLEASKEQLPEDFRVWVSNEENNLIGVNDRVDDLTKPKGFSYGIKKAIGLAKEQELRESEDLKNQGQKIDETIKNLEDIAAQVEDISVKAALQKQTEQLREQKTSLERTADERKKNAAGIFSIFG